MSRYTVSWLRDAEEQLVDLWVEAADRATVTQAQAEIDRRLASDPLDSGTDVAEGLRRLSIPPLRAYYTVDEQQRRVEVCWVGKSGSSNS